MKIILHNGEDIAQNIPLLFIGYSILLTGIVLSSLSLIKIISYDNNDN